MKVLLLPLLTIALLFTSCGDLTISGEPESTLESRIVALEKRVEELESQLAPTTVPPLEPPYSLEERVKSLESLVKSEPWEVRENPYFTPSLEERLSRIEKQLGINSSRLWNP